MIKIERRNTEKSQEAIKSLENARKAHATYNTPQVNRALKETFHGKCYICENKAVTSWQIEHLIPHKENEDLKYDWNNLFLACGHCNNTKLAKYDPILDCTKETIDQLIAFRKKGFFGCSESLEFAVLDQRIEAKNTAALLNDVYYGISTQKTMEATIIRKELRNELTKFKNFVRDYMDAEDGEDKRDSYEAIVKELSESSPFAAFKRWLIRDNREYYKELANLV